MIFSRSNYTITRAQNENMEKCFILPWQCRSKPSLAALVGCMMPFMLGVCFLCPSMDCLWHKYHYCPSCGEKVMNYELMLLLLHCHF